MAKFMKPSRTSDTEVMATAENNRAPIVRKSGGHQIIQNHPQLTKGPGALNHNPKMSKHSYKVDTNSPKSNSK